MRVPLGTEEKPAFFFHHIIPICVGCSVPGDGDDDDDGDDEEDDDDGNDGAFRGQGSSMSGGYS